MVRFTLFERRKKKEGRRKKEEGRRKKVIIKLFRYVVETRHCRVPTGILNVQLLDIFL
jgi:hypothetical protein